MDYQIELNELALLPANNFDNTTLNPQGLQGTLDGNYFIIGSASNRTPITGGIETSTGAVGVFKRASYSNYYNYLGLFRPSNIQRHAMFGMSVAITSNANYLMASAPGYNDGALTDVGTVYVYKKNPTTDFWLNLYQFRGSDIAVNDRFGTSTTITADGLYFAASSPRRNITTPSIVSLAGAVYIYKKSPTTDFWNFIQRINMNSPVQGAGFGTTIEFSSDGTYLLGSTAGGNTTTRMTIAFKKDTTTDFWSEVYRINQFSNISEYGAEFSMSSNAKYVLQNTVTTNFSTFVFVKDTVSDIWNFAQAFTVGGTFKSGCSISGTGCNIFVGWSNYFSGAGAVYFYKKRATTDYWDQESFFMSSRNQPGGNFGATVKLIGDGSLGLSAAPFQSTLGAGVRQSGVVWPYSFAETREISTNADYVVTSPPASGRSIFLLPKASSTINQNVFYKTSPYYTNAQFLTFSTLNGDFIDSISTISNSNSGSYNTSYQFFHDRLSNWYTLGSYGE